MPLVLIMAIFIMVDYDYGEDTLHDIDTNVDDMMMSKKLHCILKHCGVWLKSFNVEQGTVVLTYFDNHHLEMIFLHL